MLIPIGGHSSGAVRTPGSARSSRWIRPKPSRRGCPCLQAFRTPEWQPSAPGDTSTTTTFVVGGVTFLNHAVILRRFPEEAPDMDCIMGVVVLRRFVVEFDYVALRVIHPVRRKNSAGVRRPNQESTPTNKPPFERRSSSGQHARTDSTRSHAPISGRRSRRWTAARFARRLRSDVRRTPRDGQPLTLRPRQRTSTNCLRTLRRFVFPAPARP